MPNKSAEQAVAYTKEEIELWNTLGENPVLYLGSRIHQRIEELSKITKREITYSEYKVIDIVTGKEVVLGRNGWAKREAAKPPAQVVEFKKKRSNKGDFKTDIKRRPPTGPAMFNLDEFTGVEADVISESRK